MIAGLSPSLSTALRTAGQARATMDDMARQIATGQRVSSVKDDGATWARAARMRSDQVTRGVVSDRLDNGRLRAEVIAAGIEHSRSTMAQLRDLALSAASQTSAASFSAVSQEFLTIYWGMIQGDHTNRNGIYWGQSPAAAGFPDAATMQTGAQVLSLPNLDGTETLWSGSLASAEAHLPPGYTTGVSGGNWYVEAAPGARLYYQGTTPFGNWNPVLSDAAMAREAAAYMSATLDILAPIDARQGAMQRRLDSQAQFNSRMMDAADRNAAALTDADLGRASTARANADTRQQLALATVRQALDAYGAYAGGLLGNVQRTQRAVA